MAGNSSSILRDQARTLHITIFALVSTSADTLSKHWVAISLSVTDLTLIILRTLAEACRSESTRFAATHGGLVAAAPEATTVVAVIFLVPLFESRILTTTDASDPLGHARALFSAGLADVTVVAEAVCSCGSVADTTLTGRRALGVTAGGHEEGDSGQRNGTPLEKSLLEVFTKWAWTSQKQNERQIGHWITQTKRMMKLHGG